MRLPARPSVHVFIVTGLLVLFCFHFSWSSAPDAAVPAGCSFRAVQVSEDGRITAAGDYGIILSSADGGKTWTQHMSADRARIFDLCRAGPGRIAGAGMQGTILTGGPDTQCWIRMHTFMDHNLHTCCFFNAEEGFAAGSDGLILHTTDGGLNWQERNRMPGRTLYGLAFADDSTGFAVGQTGLVLKTRNRGITWKILDLNDPGLFANLYGAEFYGSTGLIFGAGGTLFRTEDGGRQWQRLTADRFMDIRDVCMLHEQVFISVGDSGKILVTLDGGKTWHRKNASKPAVLYGIGQVSRGRFVLAGQDRMLENMTMRVSGNAATGYTIDVKTEPVFKRYGSHVREQRFVETMQRSVGTPYVNDPLGEGPSGVFDRDPRIDTLHVDCVTALEQGLAGALCVPGLTRLNMLDRIRYRGGRVSFFNRNHFFVPDWIPGNSWLLEDVSTHIGYPAVDTLRRDIGRKKFLAYKNISIPQIKDDPDYMTLYIPFHEVPGKLPLIQEPMVIVFIGYADWLMAKHVGMVYPDPETGVMLIHASSDNKQVVQMKLADYLASMSGILGIKLLRLNR